MGIAPHSPRSGGVAVTQEVTEGIGLEGQVGFGKDERVRGGDRVIPHAPGLQG